MYIDNVYLGEQQKLFRIRGVESRLLIREMLKFPHGDFSIYLSYTQ
jgi:hypothetical protein